jgi:hypothetical protein
MNMVGPLVLGWFYAVGGIEVAEFLKFLYCSGSRALLSNNHADLLAGCSSPQDVIESREFELERSVTVRRVVCGEKLQSCLRLQL